MDGKAHDGRNIAPSPSLPRDKRPGRIGYSARPMHALEVSGLTKTYGSALGRKQEALRGVDLALPAGTSFGLIGPNGAGKTTFIKTLLGIVAPTSGELRLLGGSPKDPAIRRRLGYLPERLHLPAFDTPPSFLRQIARFKGVAWDADQIRALICRVGLEDAIDRRVGGFSKGMRQRLGLASALIGAPELLILDEPTDGIDPMGRAEIRRILADEVARGTTLFLNSHLLSETERICTRIGVLNRGKLVLEGPLETLRQPSPRWTLRFAEGAPREALLALGFEPQDTGSWQLEAADAEGLNVKLDRAREAGALLVGLTPELRDLEKVLAEAMQEAA